MSIVAWLDRPLSGRMTALLVIVGIGAVVAGGVLWTQLQNDRDDSLTALQCKAAQQEAQHTTGEQLWSTHGPELMTDLRKQDKAALAATLAQVDTYFDRAQRGTEPFSQAVVSWDAQWSLVLAKIATVIDRCDQLPRWLQWRWLCTRAKVLASVMDKQAFQKHVAGQLRRHVFSHKDMVATLQRAVKRYRKRLAANDAAVLNAMGSAAAQPEATPHAEESRPVKAFHEGAAQSALARSRQGADAELLRTVVQRVGAKLLVALTAYAVQEGAVELGLLSAGTASTLWSFGVGLAVAALANVTLRYILDRVGKSPRKSIQRRLAAEVAAMRRCVIEGCTRTVSGQAVTIPGLRSQLQRYQSQQTERRSRLLRQALIAG